MSRHISLALIALCGVAFAADEQKLNSFKFMKSHAGTLPPGWTASKTGMGDGSMWKVVADASGPGKTGYVLAQTAKGPKPLFNLCIADAAFKNLEATVALKAVEGAIDQGGGIMWRVQDPNNYYVARINPLEGNYRVYKVVSGKRIQLETQEDVKMAKDQWHVLKIRHVGKKIECFLDGKKILDASDDAIDKDGKVGLWTKADAQTHFDGFQIQTVK